METRNTDESVVRPWSTFYTKSARAALLTRKHVVRGGW